MPIVATEINDLYAAVTRPVALSIIEDIKRMSGFPQNAKTILMGALNRNIQPNSAINEITADLAGSDFLMQFSLEEDTLDETTRTNTVMGRDQNPFFLDSKLNISIKPVYTQGEFTLNIKSRFPDRNSAVKFRNDFRRFAMQGRKTNLHKASYHYPVPVELLVILIELHRLRERRSGYGDDLTTYIRNHIGANVTTLTDQAGNNATLAISETQANIVGSFDFTVQPEPAELDKDKGTWEVNFSYKYRLDKPIECVMRYPLIIHNQLLAPNFRLSESSYSLEMELQHPSIQNRILDTFRKLHPGERRGYAGISYPHFDDWLPEIKSPFHSDMLRLWVRVNPADPRNVLNLNELGDYELSPLLLTYLSQRPVSATLNLNGLVYLRLYKDNTPLDEPSLIMDSSLAVTTVADMDPRSVYHLVIALTLDMTMISPAGQTHLRDNGELVLEVADQIYPGLTIERISPSAGPGSSYVYKEPIDLSLDDIDLLGDGSLSKKDFNDIINAGKDYYRNPGVVPPDLFNGEAGSFTILAHRS